MNKKDVKYLLIIFIFLIMGSANREMNKQEGFEIYCLESSKGYEILDLEKIELPKKPLLSFCDIKLYDWQSHELYLTMEGWKKVKEKIFLENLGTDGLPFVMAIHKRPIYIGFFWTLLYSQKPETPVILLENIQDGKFIINSEGYIDIVANSELYNFLVESKKIMNKAD